MIKISLENELAHLNKLRDIFKQDADGLIADIETCEEDLERTLMGIRRSSLETGRLTKKERVSIRRMREVFNAVVTVNLAHDANHDDSETDEYEAVRNNELDVILARIADVEDRIKDGDTTMQMPC